MECRLCGSDIAEVFEAKIINKYHVRYYQCKTCGLLQTEKPYWLEEAYTCPIADIDTGVMQRNIRNATLSKLFFKLFYKKNPTLLDYGGGYGIYTRMMRDTGINCFWYDKFASPLLVKGFEYTNQSVDCLTCFELFEHFDNVKESLQSIFNISTDVLFTTMAYSNDLDVPAADWQYYAFESGQHIAFYSNKTFEWIAKQYSLNHYTIMGYHWFTKKNISALRLFVSKCIGKIYRVLLRKDVSYKYASEDMIWLKKQYSSEENCK